MTTNEPWELTADYLGGDPDQPNPIRDGRLVVDRSGGWSFVTVAPEPLRGTWTRNVWSSLGADQVRAVSHGSPNHMRALTRGAAGFMFAGAIGGLIGMATGRRNSILLLAGTRDGFEFVAGFGVEDDGARVLLGHVQADRRAAGLPALPTLEALTEKAAAGAIERQAELLARISEQLDEQTALLRRIAERST